MRAHSTPVLLLFLSSLAVAGCQQADGPMPPANEEVRNRIDDVARDLRNVMGGNKTAPEELVDDVVGFADGGPGGEALRQLGVLVARAISGRTASEETAQKLAGQLRLAVAARELSDRQRETVLNDLRDMLLAMKIPANEVETVTDQAGEVQKAVSIRSRRWYERF